MKTLAKISKIIYKYITIMLHFLRIKPDFICRITDPYEFLDKNYSISGILDNLDKLSPKELKCACCLFGVALQKACKKKRRW